MNPIRTAALAVLAPLLAGACSPTLNWRSVALPEATLAITLPCKPDHASRTVELAGEPVTLTMSGCDADGTTFAVSHAVLADPAKLGAALTHWRAAVLANLGPGASAAAVDTAFVPPKALPVPQSVRTAAQAQRAEGAVVSMEGAWFARAAGPELRLYHAVVYASTPRPAVADTFFAGLALQ